MKYEELAHEIVKLVGGRENVNGLVHCATRLRFTLKDDSKADKEALLGTKGVLTAQSAGGEFQVVIGPHVSEVYETILAREGVRGAGGTGDAAGAGKPKEKLSNRIFGVISGSFVPLLGAMAGSGMLKALLIILVQAGALTEQSSTYLILQAAANAVFYFLPIFLGITLATTLGANGYVGGVIGAALLEPNLTGLASFKGAVTFLSIPVTVADYSSTVFPVFIAVCFYALLNKLLKKIIHRNVQLFLVPMLCLLIIVPLTVLVFGPFGVYAGNAIASAVTFLADKSGWLAGLVLGGSWMFLTLLGIHNGIIPIIIQNLGKGGDPLSAMFATAVFAEMGLAVGILLRTKDKTTRTLASSTAIPGLLAGVTEPIIYGFILRYKRTIPYVVIAGAIGGAISGGLGSKSVAFAFPSIFSIPVFTPLAPYVIGITVSFVLAAVLVYFFGYEDKKQLKAAAAADLADGTGAAGSGSAQEAQSGAAVNASKQETVLSPLSGTVKPLSSVSDGAFASGAMGQGLAIEPDAGEVTSPVNGIVTNVFPSKHAIGITSDSGAEILIHVGINTVKLKGEHFTAVVEQGARVSAGDLLLRFELEKIREAGFETITPVIVTNPDQYLDILTTEQKQVGAADKLMTILF
ncbi:beta-glucoside-specific PTS transporter subunit IIABC [Paenibacillus pinistramenti]|uniref:beta-glucoside-specific PTS transporter subunit IIABC n=1 Tax=Paenibacillus pinistramenti TaxID=1768003 RepID=UPI001108EDD8|nr:beta-glucoside-specific PTS transporter subunit IIABC [Paenibacillus pinistramenti]